MSNIYWDSESDSGSGSIWYAEGINPIHVTDNTQIWGQRTLEIPVRHRGTLDELPPHRRIFETPIDGWWNGTVPETSFTDWIRQTRESIEKQSGIESKQKSKSRRLHDSILEVFTTSKVHEMIMERWG